MASDDEPYKFVYGKVNPFDGPVWMLVLTGEASAMEHVHRGVSLKLYQTVGADPHNFRDGVPRNELAVIANPIDLAAKWLMTAERLIQREGSVLVNRVGGMCTVQGFNVIDETTNETLAWPDADPDETISLSKWPRGRHWYLKSSAGRIFSPAKFDSLKQAKAAAERFVPRKRVLVKQMNNDIRKFLDAE